MRSIFVGMAGWSYEGWRGSFYPEGLKQKAELAHASRRVQAIEINGTFYSLFRPNSYQNWYAETPADFKFSIKGPRYITHERRLKDFQTPLHNFLASGILALGEKLGCILWQFPPTMPFLPERFEPFMAALPQDMLTAAQMGRQHSSWLEGRTFLKPSGPHRLCHAIEGRHESFLDPVLVDMARRYGIALVLGDTAGRWPLIEDVTSDFLYLRLHGDETKYPEGYTREALEYWGRRVATWSSGRQPDPAALIVPGPIAEVPRTVFVYFDNDVKETAPLNALSLITHLTQQGIMPGREVEGAPLAEPRTSKTAAVAREVPSKSKTAAKSKTKSKTAARSKANKPAAAKKTRKKSA